MFKLKQLLYRLVGFSTNRKEEGIQVVNIAETDLLVHYNGIPLFDMTLGETVRIRTIVRDSLSIPTSPSISRSRETRPKNRNEPLGVDQQRPPLGETAMATRTQYLYVDRSGKMPQLRNGRWESETHPYYIRYVGDTPIAYHGPADVLAQDVTGSKVWDYSANEFVPLDSLKSE